MKNRKQNEKGCILAKSFEHFEEKHVCVNWSSLINFAVVANRFYDLLDGMDIYNGQKRASISMHDLFVPIW